MKVRKSLELSIDVMDIFNELPQVLQALLDTMPNKEGKVALLQVIKQDVDNLLEGAETYGKPLREPGRIEKDQ